MNLVRKQGGELMRPLKVLVPMIKDELEAGDAAGIEHYRAAGEMLLEAKDQVAHGEWGAWIERNFHLGERQARRYMQLANQNGRSRPFSTLTAATEPNRAYQPARSWQAPVRAIASSVNVERLAQERDNREKEQRLMHDLAHKVIDIGYRVLATKLHPDKGGSHEAMKRLNEVRRILKEAL